MSDVAAYHVFVCALFLKIQESTHLPALETIHAAATSLIIMEYS
jgi:hypothetical protein